jgi:universal stress protein A
MYKTILCAIEATKEGEVVLSKASEIAKLNNSRLVVIYVLPYTLLPKDYQKELKESAIPKIEKISTAFDIPKKNRVVKVGKPYEQICTLAVKQKADLIVIGSHSKKGIQSLIGSTANAVINYAKCDVTLVRL